MLEPREQPPAYHNSQPSALPYTNLRPTPNLPSTNLKAQIATTSNAPYPPKPTSGQTLSYLTSNPNLPWTNPRSTLQATLDQAPYPRPTPSLAWITSKPTSNQPSTPILNLRSPHWAPHKHPIVDHIQNKGPYPQSKEETGTGAN